MIDVEQYKIWTTPFSPGSFFEGGLNTGDSIKFYGPDENGGLMGMVSQIAESKPFEFISIKHLGFIKDGVKDFDSEEVKKWTPSFEN